MERMRGLNVAALAAITLCVLIAVRGSLVEAEPVYVESFGSKGTGAGEFSLSMDVAVDAVGDVYVVEGLNHRVQKLDTTGGIISHEWLFGGEGSGDGEFDWPRGACVDSAENIYVADWSNNRIQKLSQAGGVVSHEWSFGSHGSADGEFLGPFDVAVDAAGYVYAADKDNHRIQKLSQAGCVVSHVWSYGSNGSGDGQFYTPWGLAVGSDGSIYVADRRNHRIQKLSQTGGSVSYELSFGTEGGGNGQFQFPQDVAIDSVGNVYVTDQDNCRVQRWFDPDALPVGGTATFGDLTLWADPDLGRSIALGSGQTINVLNVMTVEAGGTLALSAATLNAGRLLMESQSLLNIEGAVNAAVECHPGAQINVTGNAILGDAGRHDGFVYEGRLSVGANTVTLNSKGFATLGSLTELGGGTLVAPNGVVIGAGRSLVGSGVVNARASAALGSTIEATGDMTLGDSSALDGFFSDGSLVIGGNTVTISDLNVAVLGSLTTIGDGVQDGTLTAANGFLLEQGKNLSGFGVVNGEFKNNGDVYGGTGGETLEFTGLVTGIGDFHDSVTFSGGFSPGLSAAEVELGDVTFAPANTLTMELGGTTPGSEYDRLIAAGHVAIGGALHIELIDGFVPGPDDTFDILSFDSWSGDFAMIEGADLGNGLMLQPVFGPEGLSLVASGRHRRAERSFVDLLGAAASRDDQSQAECCQPGTFH